MKYILKYINGKYYLFTEKEYNVKDKTLLRTLSEIHASVKDAA